MKNRETWEGGRIATIALRTRCRAERIDPLPESTDPQPDAGNQLFNPAPGISPGFFKAGEMIEPPDIHVGDVL